MGGGGSKPKASDRSLEVEQQIIQRQQAAEAQIVPGDSPNKSRSKSVHISQRVPGSEEVPPKQQQAQQPIMNQQSPVK